MSKRVSVLLACIVAAACFFCSVMIYKNLSPDRIEGSKSDLSRAHAPLLGPENAPVTITEFFDPACEACRAYYPYVKEIMANYPTQVRVVMRYAPFHNGSREAVEILGTARLQNKFEPVLLALFETQQEWADHDAPDIALAWQAAQNAGLDLLRATEDLKRPEIDASIEQDIADLSAFNIKQTPTFFVNGVRARASPEGLAEMVGAAVGQSIDP